MKEQAPIPKIITRREAIILGVAGAATAATIGVDYVVTRVKPKIDLKRKERLVTERVIFRQ